MKAGTRESTDIKLGALSAAIPHRGGLGPNNLMTAR
jgi:hypothetical protein